MRCPTLKELPPLEATKTGWPWTEECPQLPDTMPDGTPWPKTSIVTPSLNQGLIIEETIRSVLLQGYPDLEYIIIDGGSTDGSVDIIKKYENWLAYWVSEPDKGQSHAINKGFARASGEMYAYINSDDFYEPNAFQIVASLFAKSDKPHLVAGECVIFDGDIIKRIFEPGWPERLSCFLEKTYSSTFAQPASFWSKNIYEQVGGLDETLNFCFDREFFLRIGLAGVEPYLLPRKIARFREHSDSKTVVQGVRFHGESILILHKHAEACGIGEKRRRKIAKEINNEIRYAEVFTTWIKRGRIAAMRKFLSTICRSPSLIFERKILGQARRLISFSAKDVDELKTL